MTFGYFCAHVCCFTLMLKGKASCYLIPLIEALLLAMSWSVGPTLMITFVIPKVVGSYLFRLLL